MSQAIDEAAWLLCRTESMARALLCLQSPQPSWSTPHSHSHSDLWFSRPWKLTLWSSGLWLQKRLFESASGHPLTWELHCFPESLHKYLYTLTFPSDDSSIIIPFHVQYPGFWTSRGEPPCCLVGWRQHFGRQTASSFMLKPYSNVGVVQSVSDLAPASYSLVPVVRVAGSWILPLTSNYCLSQWFPNCAPSARLPHRGAAKYYAILVILFPFSV
jgi:hypothetical protein